LQKEKYSRSLPRLSISKDISQGNITNASNRKPEINEIVSRKVLGGLNGAINEINALIKILK